MWRKLYRNYLPILSGLAFLLMLGAMVLEIDRQIYQGKKKEICTRRFERICPASLTRDLEEFAQNYFVAENQARLMGEKRRQFLAAIRKQLEVIDATTSRLALPYWRHSWEPARLSQSYTSPTLYARLNSQMQALEKNITDMAGLPELRKTLRPRTDPLLDEIARETSHVAQVEQAALSREAAANLRAMRNEAKKILGGNNPLVGVSAGLVLDPENDVTVEAMSYSADKFRKLNTFRNSLLDRRFSGETSRSFGRAETPDLRIGELRLRYTTPADFPQIEALTARFRWYIAGVVFVMSLVYWYILRHLIMPIRYVTNRIDRSKGDLPEVLAHPRSYLESAYNDLARDALLTSLTHTMAEYMSVDRLVAREEIIGGVPQWVAPYFGFAAVHAVEMTVGATLDEPVHWTRSATHGKADGRLPKPSRGDWLELGRAFNRDWRQPMLDFTVSNGRRSRPYFAVPIVTDSESGRVTFLAATPRGALTQEVLQWNRETLARIAAAVRAGLATLDLQRQLIVREKSKANVSLSRALGHDLTNVVATSKLELDTVRRFLNLAPDRQARLNGQSQSILRESLEGLLNNTKFLQEIINIYRSFSYMHHPKYERVDFNALLTELVELFRLSVSRRMQVNMVFAPDLPYGWVEPRLLKLAVFNLLTNATDALKRRDKFEGDFTATLSISTEYAAADQTIRIAVRDNGEGIRNAQGDLASPDEIRTIFRAGFTTKREQMAEGLGLNWVRQIVCEFHRGRLDARNCPEGGAEVAIHLPLYNEPPAQGVFREEPDTANGRDELAPAPAEGK